MSGHRFREDKECENCGYAVDVAFCSKCGQKNVETRQSFPSLVGHFAEDLTHYDSAFWKSLKHLLFNPGRLTRIYLEGKRQEYVPPVKLYIFISFITFLLLGILPDSPAAKEAVKESNIELELTPKEEDFEIAFGRDNVYKSSEELEAGYKKGEIGYLPYHFAKAAFEAHEKNPSDAEIGEIIVHTIPKAIFLYMPIFSFWIWLLHGKKRWYFFDHGIFTLHYFSFLLLVFTIINLISWGLGYVLNSVDAIEAWLYFIGMCYAFFYFFRSHRRMYGETRLVSRCKSIVLFVINMICISIIITGLLYYALINVH